MKLTGTNTWNYDKHTVNQLYKIHVTSLNTGISYDDLYVCLSKWLISYSTWLRVYLLFSYHLISQELFNLVLYFLLLSIYHLLMRILIEWKDEFVNLFDVSKGRGSIRLYISLSLALGHAIHLLQIKELCCY